MVKLVRLLLHHAAKKQDSENIYEKKTYSTTILLYIYRQNCSLQHVPIINAEPMVLTTIYI